MKKLLGQVPNEHEENPQTPKQIFLTRRQIAERWACCEHSVARKNELKPLRFNRRMLRYRLEDVLAIEAAAK